MALFVGSELVSIDTFTSGAQRGQSVSILQAASKESQVKSNCFGVLVQL
jgi:hypothetical protein